jgi:hypothetical protein
LTVGYRRHDLDAHACLASPPSSRERCCCSSSSHFRAAVHLPSWSVSLPALFSPSLPPSAGGAHSGALQSPRCRAASLPPSLAA